MLNTESLKKRVGSRYNGEVTSDEMASYHEAKVYVLDGELKGTIFELNRAMKSPWPEDLVPAVRGLLEVLREYRSAVKSLLESDEEEI